MTASTRGDGHTRAWLAALTLALLLSTAACGVFAAPSDTDASPTDGTTASASPTPSPSMSPTPGPTDTSGPITGEPKGAPVTPEIFFATVDTSGGVLRVVVTVPDIYEDGGLCTVTVVDHAVTISKQNVGAADATATACGQFTFALRDLPSGTATIVAHYESDDHEGSSEPTEVEIP